MGGGIMNTNICTRSLFFAPKLREPRIAGPIVDIPQHIKEVTLGHPGFEERFDGREFRRHRAGLEAFEMRDPLRINGERGLRRVGVINLLGDLAKTRLKLRDEGRGSGGELDRLTVGRQARHTGRPGQELLTVIGIRL